MAKKGQKFSKYAPEFIAKIMEKYSAGKYTARMLSVEYNVPQKTVENWITKHNHGINVAQDHRKIFSGRTKEENIDYKERYEILKKYQAFIEARREKK